MNSKVHAIISVDSRGRNEGVSASHTDFVYQLTQPINFYKRSDNKQYFIRCENVKIPVSFYNINSNYNVFNFTLATSGAVAITIDSGNYTIDELIAELETQMNVGYNTATSTALSPFTISYNEITQKVSIASASGAENVTVISGNGWRLIGFELTQTITNNTTEIATNVAYTSTSSVLKLQISNIVSNNVYSNSIVEGSFKQTNLQNVSVSIPVKEIRNEFIFIDNHMGPMIKLPNISNIKNINVRLLDVYNNVVSLNGLFFSFDLVIYEHNKSPLFKNM